MIWGALLAASGLALIHLLGCNLRLLDAAPRSRWLSAAGGVSVAYAMVHLLPELHSYADPVAEFGGDVVPRNERLIYAIALLGLVVFYGLERAVRISRRQPTEEATGKGVFWLHMTSYAIYNSLIGYLLVREDRDSQRLLLFFIGIGLHFWVNDHSLQIHHREPYRRRGRWLLSAAILVGCATGLLTEVHPGLTASITAFLSGVILLNTFKEELPTERESRFGAFCLGATVYAAIMLAA